MSDEVNLVRDASVNPVPLEGWSTRLTPYEVEYVRAFGVRPERKGWLADEETFAALEREGKALSDRIHTSTDQIADQMDIEAFSESEDSQGAHRTFSQWWMALVLLPLFVVTSAFVGSGAMNLIENQRLQVVIEDIERLSDEVK